MTVPIAGALATGLNLNYQCLHELSSLKKSVTGLPDVTHDPQTIRSGFMRGHRVSGCGYSKFKDFYSNTSAMALRRFIDYIMVVISSCDPNPKAYAPHEVNPRP
jgi:hypothetical protein